MRNIQDKLDCRIPEAGWIKPRQMFDAKGIKVATILEVGLVPANNIIRRAEDDKFDRIVMGSTGRSGAGPDSHGEHRRQGGGPRPLRSNHRSLTRKNL